MPDQKPTLDYAQPAKRKPVPVIKWGMLIGFFLSLPVAIAVVVADSFSHAPQNAKDGVAVIAVLLPPAFAAAGSLVGWLIGRFCGQVRESQTFTRY